MNASIAASASDIVGGGVCTYREHCDDIAAKGYAGFLLAIQA